MIKTRVLNNIVVRPVKVNKINKDQILGYDIFPEIYNNTFITARKKSGKTCVLCKILRACSDKRTKVIVFCPTYQKDSTWIQIRKMLDNRGIENEFYMSIMGDDGVNNLDELISEMAEDLDSDEDDDEDSEDTDEEEKQILSFDSLEVEITIKKPRKPKYISPKYIIVMDDISTELRNPSVAKLLKTNRHYKSKVILSSQWLNDISPMSRRQIDNYILFKGINEAKLQELYNNADLSITLEDFEALYNNATSEKYNFLYVDAVNSNFRKNFNTEYLISEK